MQKGILLIDDDVLFFFGIDAFHERMNGLYYFITYIYIEMKRSNQCRFYEDEEYKMKIIFR
jgi:hypothetical protein